jgi:TolB-like protein
VPPELAVVLERMLAKNPDARFPTPASVADALTPFRVSADLARLLAEVDLEPLPRVQNAPPVEVVARPASEAVPTHTRHPVRLVLVAVLAVLLVGGGLSAAVRFWLRPPIPPVVSADPPREPTPAPEPNQPDPKHEEPAPDDPKPEEQQKVLPVALLAFEERDKSAKDLGAKVTDLLFAKLAAKPTLFLVDRTDIKKVLDEQALNLSGAVKADEATKVGQLTGARLLVTGSVVQVEKKVYLVAKVISSETGRVAGASVDGVQSDDLGALVGKLADAIDDTITKQGEKLVPKPVRVKDRVAELNKKLGKSTRPSLALQVRERYFGLPSGAASVHTELARFARETGFELLESGPADVIISGEGICSVGGPVGTRMVSVQARVALRAEERKSGRILASDQQTVVIVDLSEQFAGSQALQEATARLAERMLPRCVESTPKKK